GYSKSISTFIANNSDILVKLLEKIPASKWPNYHPCGCPLELRTQSSSHSFVGCSSFICPYSSKKGILSSTNTTHTFEIFDIHTISSAFPTTYQSTIQFLISENFSIIP